MGAIDLFSEVGGMPLPEAAARFAAAGVPVFPCVPGEKRPLVARGFRDATADPLRFVGTGRFSVDGKRGLSPQLELNSSSHAETILNYFLPVIPTIIATTSQHMR